MYEFVAKEKKPAITVNTSTRKTKNIDNLLEHKSGHDSTAAPGKTSQQLRKLQQGQTFTDGHEQHHIYLDSYQGKPTIMMASAWPKPFSKYIELLQHSLNEKAVKLVEMYNTAYKTAEENAKIKEGSSTELDFYTDGSIAVINDFLKNAANFIEENSEFLPPISEAQFNLKKPVSESTKPQSLGEKIFYVKGTQTNYDLSEGVHVPILSAKGDPGTIADETRLSPGSGIRMLRDKIGQKDEGGRQKYTLGHLLNHWLHGSGTDPENLALITSQLNGNTAMPGEAEAWAKERIFNNRVLDYKVEVFYKQASAMKNYEDMMPAQLKYTIKEILPDSGDKFEKIYGNNPLSQTPINSEVESLEASEEESETTTNTPTHLAYNNSIDKFNVGSNFGTQSPLLPINNLITSSGNANLSQSDAFSMNNAINSKLKRKKFETPFKSSLTDKKEDTTSTQSSLPIGKTTKKKKSPNINYVHPSSSELKNKEQDAKKVKAVISTATSDRTAIITKINDLIYEVSSRATRNKEQLEHEIKIIVDAVEDGSTSIYKLQGYYDFLHKILISLDD